MKVNYQVLSFIIVLFITLSFTQSNATGSPADKKSGCLYMQTNGINNEIIYYARMDNGNLVEKQRITTGGAGAIMVNEDPAADAVPGDGKFKALDMVVSSGPNDSWISPDGKYFYQIYPNASKLISYKIKGNGKLKKADTKDIPYTTPQGLAGY